MSDADTFWWVFKRVNPQELSENLREWLEYQRRKEDVASIDEKTICGGGNAKHKTYHIVGAFVAENHIALREVKTEEKSNEITAAPKLLDMLEIEGGARYRRRDEPLKGDSAEDCEERRRLRIERKRESTHPDGKYTGIF